MEIKNTETSSTSADESSTNEHGIETKEDIETQTATLYGLVLQHIKHVADMTLSVASLEN